MRRPLAARCAPLRATGPVSEQSEPLSEEAEAEADTAGGGSDEEDYLEEGDDSDHEFYGRLFGDPAGAQSALPAWAGGAGAYTPFEYIEFEDTEVHHDLEVTVHAPLDQVFAAWRERLNYPEWFSLIGQVILHPPDQALASYFLFYHWGALPALELYMTLERAVVEGEFIGEQSVDGMEFSAAAYFRRAQACEDAVGDASTVVRLRLAYYLPINLRAFVGHVGVWADVNAVLEGDMQAMKALVEGADAGELAALRARERAALNAQAARPLHVQARGPDAAAAGAPGAPGPAAPGPAPKKQPRRRARKPRPRQTATL